MINETVIVRGGGDIASGTIQKLFRSGFKVLILEVKKPTSIRRSICFSEAVYDGYAIVEGIKAVLTSDLNEIKKAWEDGFIPVVVDNEGSFIQSLKPIAVVDAILAKKNLGTNKKMAPITVALGPGFEAGKDVDVVIETMRGHNLGSLIFEGSAMANTGVPGEIGGFSKERVIYSPFAGKMKNVRKIGDLVEAGEIIAYVDQVEVKASISGVLRGIMREGNTVAKGLKIADIDPRGSEKNNCFTISDKARSIGGGVLEAILFMKNKVTNY